jgi:hypothetical protein
MRLYLYVEDQYHQAYEALARKWYATSDGSCDVSAIRAVRLRPDQMCHEMRDHVLLAHRSGFNCIVFVLDREAPHARTDLIDQIQAAFDRLCNALPDDKELDGVTLGLVIAESCLECWLLTDTQAVVRFACRNRQQVSYRPEQSNETERLNPKQASDAIRHILRETARKQGNRNANRLKHEKSANADIVEHMADIGQAIRRNGSLLTFCKLVTCRHKGCSDANGD